MLVSAVHPVAILSALFCIVCSLVMLVCEIVGDQMEDAYSRMGRVIALYVEMIVSFCLPQLVDVSACRIGIVLCAFVHVFCMWVVNVCVCRS